MAQFSVFTSDPDKLHLSQSSSGHLRRSSKLSSGRTKLNTKTSSGRTKLDWSKWTYQCTRLPKEIYSLVAYFNPDVLGYYGLLSSSMKELNPC